jgi:hypothetical protein
LILADIRANTLVAGKLARIDSTMSLNVESPQNQTMNLTGPASWLFEAQRHCSRPGKLSYTLGSIPLAFGVKPMKMSACSQFALLSALVLILCGCHDGRRDRSTSSDSSGNVEGKTGGYPSPDAALDAMVNAIKTDDIKTYKESWSMNLKEVTETEHMFEVAEKATTPEAIEKQWKELFKFWRDDAWKDGDFKRYPAEIDGAKASITCALTLDRYVRYDLKKVDGSWHLSDHVVLSAKKVDPKYLWKKGNDK